MARLIVEDGGRRRAFRVREGKLTIGSGEACTLTLAAAGVAEVHAELEIAGGRAVLSPRPGVVAPTVDGRPVASPVVLSDGSRIAVGEAELVYQEEEAAPSAAPAPATAPAARPAAAARAAATAAAPAASGAARRSPVRTGRPLHRVKKGPPTWLVLLGIAVVLVVGGFVFAKMWKKGATGFDPVGRYNAAVALHDQGNLLQAEQELAKLAGVELPGDLAAKVADLRRAIAASHADRELRFHNEKGGEYLETQLKRYERERLQGDPRPEVARVFLKRCREFRERWPQHPEMGWIDRYETRFRGVVDLSTPPTYADVAFEIESLTWAKPRDYEEAFAILDRFVETGPAGDRDRALALRDKLDAERAEYFEDRMLQAKWHWEKDEHGQAVEWLVQVIMKIGDPALAAEASRELLLLPGIEGWLSGYKQNNPDKWERLVREPSIADYAAEHGF